MTDPALPNTDFTMTFFFLSDSKCFNLSYSSWDSSSFGHISVTLVDFPRSLNNWSFLCICLYNHFTGSDCVSSIWSYSNGFWSLSVMVLDQGEFMSIIQNRGWLIVIFYTEILTRKVVLTCFFIGEIHNSTFLVSQNLSIEHGFFQRQRKIWPTRLIFSWNFKTLHLTIFWIFFDPIKKNRTFRGAERTQSSLKTSLDTHLDI